MNLTTSTFLLAAFCTWLYAVHRLTPRPSVALVLFASLLIVHVAPLLVYLNLTGPDTVIFEAAFARVDADEVKQRILWAMTLMFFALIGGAEMACQLVPNSWRRNQRYAKAVKYVNLTSVYRAGPVLRLLLWLVAASMLAVILTENQPAKIFNYFSEGGLEIEKIALRASDGGTPYYLYNVFLYSLAPFVVMVLWCMHCSNPQDRQLAALGIVFFVLVFVGKLGTLSKAPPVIFLLQLALLSALLKQKNFSWIPIVKLLVLALGLFAVIVRLTIPDLELAATVNFLYYRIFDIPNEVVVEYFSAIPKTLPHGWEYGIFGTRSRPPGAPDLQYYFTVAEVTRDFLLSTSNAMFIGDAWAEYSWLGVLSTSFAAGAVLRTIDLYSLRNGFTDEWACILAGCTFGVFTMLSTAFSTALITGGLLFLPLLSFGFVRYPSRQHGVSFTQSAAK